MGYDEIPKLTEETVSASDSSTGAVYLKVDGEIVGQAKRVVVQQLEHLTDKELLQAFEITDVSTVHQIRSLWGKFKDFLCWKTPYRRFYYKPFYIQVDLADELERYSEHTGLFEGLSAEKVEILIRTCKGIKVWQEKYPEDPYSVIVSNFNITPTIPIQYTQITGIRCGEKRGETNE